MPQSQTGCHGNGADHCCYWGGEPCPWLEQDTVPGRRWACGLYRVYGNWGDVHASSEYAADVEPRWRSQSALWEWLWQEGVRCGDWGMEGNVQQGMASKIRVPGNAPQWQKDFQSTCIADWQRAQNGEQVEWLCCFGNRPEV